jgi:DNA mismatch repair protein MutL
MSRIRQLDTSVINKIAAGEVIERPASVVKELVENSLDSGATRIDIDIERGGADLIRIVDNGQGIHPDDMLLAVSSHATSKLKSADDLFRVMTMGFRGEALASIAEVSHLTLRSRQPDQEYGRELLVLSGEQGALQTCGCAPGTRIEVRDLFVNTPVRRKFMKTAATEFHHLTEQFTRLALANPAVHFTLTHNGKSLYDLPPTDDLRTRLAIFLGQDVIAELISITGEQPGAKLTGFVGHPRISKSTRKQQYLFLNRRWIQDRSLQHALTEAYRGLLMIGRQPMAFLFLEIAATEVDVNVHPTKSEVRFVDSQTLYRLVLGTIRRQFLTMNLESELNLKAPLNDPAKPGYELPAEPTPAQLELMDWAVSALAGRTSAERPPAAATYARQVSGGAPPWSHTGQQYGTADISGENEFDAQFPYSNANLHQHLDQHLSEPTPQERLHAQQLQEMSVRIPAMQVDNCYLVIPGETGLTVIDQHALHERILYEQFKRRVLAKSVESQRMLVPETIELPVRECELLLQNQTVLEELGFGISEFGTQTILVDRYPVILGKTSIADLMKEICEKLDGNSPRVQRAEVLESLLQMMSCKAAVKAGQRLSPTEIDTLLELRHLVDHAHHCPHGRPTILNLTRAELDKQFGRLG